MIIDIQYDIVLNFNICLFIIDLIYKLYQVNDMFINKGKKMTGTSPQLFIMKSKITNFESFVSEKVMYSSVHQLEEAKTEILKNFFELLGYNPDNSKEVIKDYKVDDDNHIDYALLNDTGKPHILIVSSEFKYILTECHLIHLQHAFNKTTSTVLGVLTNGQIFQFYQINPKSNMMDIKPFLAVDFVEYVHREPAAVAILHKMKKPNNKLNNDSYTKIL